MASRRSGRERGEMKRVGRLLGCERAARTQSEPTATKEPRLELRREIESSSGSVRAWKRHMEQTSLFSSAPS